MGNSTVDQDFKSSFATDNLIVSVVSILIVLVVLLSLSIAISQLADKCKRLTQANAILEKRVRDLEEKQ